MKTIYFVRHGESEGNAGHVFQGPSTPLTEKGREQAAAIAQRCKNIRFDTMIASTLRRVQETATAISEATGKRFISEALFDEVLRPSHLIGKPQTDREAHAVEAAWRASGEGEPKVGDGEDFYDVLARARQALSLLESHPSQDILVVTSAYFMRVLCGYVIFGNDLTPLIFKPFRASMGMENTGLTVVRHEASREAHPWRLWIWNDHAHLG